MSRSPVPRLLYYTRWGLAWQALPTFCTGWKQRFSYGPGSKSFEPLRRSEAITAAALRERGASHMAVLPRWMWASVAAVPRGERRSRAEAPARPLSTPVFGVLMIGAAALVGAAWITARMKVDALRAEERQLRTRIADLDAENRILQTDIVRALPPDVIAAADVELAMAEPTAVDVARVPSLADIPAASAASSSPAERALRFASEMLGARMGGTIARPAGAAVLPTTPSSEPGPSEK
jgi:hypothetical protein